jgi:hypothetical protein
MKEDLKRFGETAKFLHSIHKRLDEEDENIF